MGVIQKYLLPKEVDFNAALQKQVAASKQCILDLCQYCEAGDKEALKSIINDEHQSRLLKSKNMHELLDVFITPYDKESIYRIIIQLDWIALSVKHMAIELLAYDISCSKDFNKIIDTITNMVEALDKAFLYLPQKKLGKILSNIERIHDHYDDTVKQCAVLAANYLKKDDLKTYLANKEIINQLKDIAKHLHLSANTLEDMAMKII